MTPALVQAAAMPFLHWFSTARTSDDERISCASAEALSTANSTDVRTFMCGAPPIIVRRLMPTPRLSSATRGGLVVAAALFCACPPPGPAHPVTVTFHVNVPLSTPTSASVSIAGDAPALGNGSGPGLVLDKLAEGQFSGKADLEAESSVHYQIVQRQPDAVELRDDFTVPDRSFTVGRQG